MSALAARLAAGFVSTSMQVVVLVGLILLAERAFRGVLPAAWRYALWCLVLLRLACPVVPASPLSPLNLLSCGRSVEAPQVVSGPAAADVTTSGSVATRPVGGGPGAPAAGRLLAGAALPLGHALPALFVGLWFLGFAGLVLKGFRDAATFHARLRRGHDVRNPAVRSALESCRLAMGVRRSVRLLETDAVSAPALTGLLHPALLLPVGLLDRLSPAECEWVFLHELAHLRRQDLPVDALLSLLQALHWPNPFVHLAARRLRAAREAACDAHVLERRPGSPDAVNYGQTLLRLAATMTPAPALPGVATTVESSCRLEARLLAIRAFRPSHRRQHLVGLAVLLLVAVLGLSRAVDAPAAGAALAPAPAGAPSSPPEIPPDVAAAAIEEQFSRHPLVSVSARFIDIPGTPVEVSQALGTLGVWVPATGASNAASAMVLSPADTERFLAALPAGALDAASYGMLPADALAHAVTALAAPAGWGPKVTVMNDCQAILRVVTERYFPESWTVEPCRGAPKHPRAKFEAVPKFGEAVDVGCVLGCLPHLDPGCPDQARLDLTARCTEFRGYRAETLTHTDESGRQYTLPVHYPKLDVRSASATLALPVGYSVCLYGGTLTTQTQVVDKVPVLGSVPLLGRWFQTPRQVETAKALLVLVRLDRVGSVASLATPAP